MPATPTSARSWALTPRACAVTRASRATGRSLVPAVMIMTRPIGGSGVPAGGPNVRAKGSFRAGGEVAERSSDRASGKRWGRRSSLGLDKGGAPRSDPRAALAGEEDARGKAAPWGGLQIDGGKIKVGRRGFAQSP